MEYIFLSATEGYAPAPGVSRGKHAEPDATHPFSRRRPVSGDRQRRRNARQARRAPLFRAFRARAYTLRADYGGRKWARMAHNTGAPGRRGRAVPAGKARTT